MKPKNSDRKKYVIGIDFGGTSIRAGLVSLEGSLLSKDITVPSHCQISRQATLSNITSAVTQLLDIHDLTLRSIKSIGIGAPGPLNCDEGRFLNPPNLPYFRNYPICAVLHEYFRKPVFLQNDGNCFTLGEAVFGAGIGKSIVIGITLGTGIGAGMCCDGKIYTGSTGTSFEIWKSPYLSGTIEDYVSGKGIARIYGSNVSAVTIYERAASGEQEAIRAWEKFGFHTGFILSYLVNFLDPDVIVIGGSVSKASKYYKRAMRAAVKANINELPLRNVRIKFSKKVEHSGILGAAALALQGSLK